MTDHHDQLLVTVADLRAMEDVLDRVIEMTESMAVEEAAEYKFSCEALAKKAKLAADMCNMQGVKTLEGGRAGPVKIGRNTYKVDTAEKWVTDFPKLRQRIITKICYNPDTGAKRRITVEDAVTEAVDMVVDLYVAPSDVPKAGGLKKLRLAKHDVMEDVGGKQTLVQVIGP